MSTNLLSITTKYNKSRSKNCSHYHRVISSNIPTYSSKTKFSGSPDTSRSFCLQPKPLEIG